MKLGSKFSLVQKLLESKAFRDSYVYEHVRNSVPFQIRALRDQREWTQGKLGEVARKPRNVITRLEDPNYGKLTLKTLFEIASAFDVALLVKFVPFSRLLREYEDVSPSALSAKSISTEVKPLRRWAAAKDATVADLESNMITASEARIVAVQPPSKITLAVNKELAQQTLFRTHLEVVTQKDQRLVEAVTTAAA